MRLTKFLGRKCKVCMRILLLKSLFLGTNCPLSFLFCVESFLFLSWICFWPDFDIFCFCRGFVFVSAVDTFVYIPSFFLLFLFSPLFLLLSPTKSEKRGSFFGKSPSFFWKSPSFFGKSPSFFGGDPLTSILPEPPCGEQKGSATL